MKFSIIIPTYNRLNELKELIPSLSSLNYNPEEYELVIIDDGSTDDSLRYLEHLETPFEIVIRSQQNKGPGPARNHGMSVARGDYFIFVDSDCILPSDYLTKVDEALKKDNFEAFGGPDTYHPSFSPLLKAINYAMTSFLGTAGTRGSKKSLAKYYPRSFNMGFHRKVFAKIGGFSALRHGQDMDFSARIYEAGFKVGLISDAFVYHKRRTSLKKYFKQIFNWGVTRINLSILHQGMLKPIHMIPTLLVLSGLSITILVIANIISSHLMIIGLIGVSLICLIAFFQSLTTYKSIKVGILSMITILTQIVAYGLGVISGLFQIYILKKEMASGFSKNYYK